MQIEPPQAQSLSRPALTSLRFLRHRLEQALADPPDGDAILARAAQVLTSTVGQECIAWVTAARKEVRLTGLNLPVEGLSEPVRQTIAERAVEALRSNVSHVSFLDGSQQVQCICAPVTGVSEPGVLVVLHSAASDSLATAIAATELAASAIASADYRRESQRSAREAASAGALVDMLARAEAAGSLQAGTRAICRELRQHFQCRDVLLGQRDPETRKTRLLARAEVAAADEELQVTTEAALHETLMHPDPVRFPPDDTCPRHALLAHRQLAGRLNATTLVSSPLRTEDGTARGAVILVGDPDQLAEPWITRFLEAAEPRIAATLALLEKTERRGLEKLAQRAAAIVASRSARGILAGVVGFILLLCIPLPYKVSASCELQPLHRRFIAAPFEAPLMECLAEPGDIVEQGQLLARLDGRELRMQLAEVASERNRAAKERDMHRAKGEYGAAEMARLQAEALQARKELLEYRGQNLEIRSPAAGVVVSGDWKKSQGIPVKTGETMFEIAPLDRMIVEVAIPEDDITWVAAGQPVRVRLDAYGTESWDGTLRSVHPAAEMREKEHVFVGEVELQNPRLRLRPGMRGRAKVRTGSHPLLWNLFHKPVNKFIAWLRYTI